jgi:16S rRNA (guanine527-N7)-methyltransferase
MIFTWDDSYKICEMDEAFIRTYLQKLPFAVDRGLAGKLLAYLDLLVKWNKAYNLTAIRSPDEMLTHHILDSLVVSSYLEGPRILDVGTGPGFPGLPLAMLRSEYQFILLDSNAKKTRFVSQAVLELGLENVEVVTSRVENYEPEQVVNTVISRAFSRLDEFVQKTSRFCVKKGLLIAMKGRYPSEEIASLGPDFKADIVKTEVPDLNAERHLVLVRL